MKKQNFYKAGVCFLLIGNLFISNSCNDRFLEDVKNQGAFDTSNYFQNEEQSQTVLISVYDVMRKYSGGFENLVTFANAGSDDFYAGGGSSTDGAGIQGFSTYTINARTMPGTYWNDYYQGIARANLLLDKIGGASMNDSTRNRFIGEAKTLRALYYFELLRMFRNIPLILKPVSAADDYYNIPQEDPAKVYAQIESDILEAIPALPMTLSGAERGRISQGTARAILGKIYLYDKKYPQAAEQFKEVNGTPGATSQYGYKLVSDYNSLWAVDNKFTTESVLEVVHTNKGNSDWGFWGQGRDEGNSINIMIGPRSYNRLSNDAPDLVSGWAFNPATQNLADFMQGDPRFASTLIDLKQLKATGKADYSPAYLDSGFFIKKYAPTKDVVSTLPGATELNFRQNYIVIRLADTYLMEAEALGSTGSRAQALLDAVRSRVGLAPVPVSLQAIKNERRRELAGEGHRWYDLVRWGDAATVLASRGFKAGKNEVLPIPYQELINTKIVQNPGY